MKVLCYKCGSDNLRYSQMSIWTQSFQIDVSMKDGGKTVKVEEAEDKDGYNSIFFGAECCQCGELTVISFDDNVGASVAMGIEVRLLPDKGVEIPATLEYRG